jgi:hypothetical protein
VWLSTTPPIISARRHGASAGLAGDVAEPVHQGMSAL